MSEEQRDDKPHADSPTPRTDAIYKQYDATNFVSNGELSDVYELARELERELIEARRQRDLYALKANAVGAYPPPFAPSAVVARSNVEHIPEYFAKPRVTEALAEAHPVLLVRQMANEILRLRSMPSAKGAWISVNDRLPEEDVRVVVLYGNAPEIARHLPCPGFKWRGDLGYFVTSLVTHWMPLPSAPPDSRTVPE